MNWHNTNVPDLDPDQILTNYRISETDDDYNVSGQNNDQNDNDQNDAIRRLNDRLEQYNNQLNTFENKLKSATQKSFEIIGLFSSVMALLIINVNIVSSSHSLPSAIILVIGLTCSISVFAGLIHILFGGNNVDKKLLFIPHIILVILLSAAIFKDYKFYDKIHEEVTSKNIDSLVINNVKEFTGERINGIVKQSIFIDNASIVHEQLNLSYDIDRVWKDSIIVKNL